MTVYEKLFGTPERTADTLSGLAGKTIDMCCIMDLIRSGEKSSCDQCMYEPDWHGCHQKDMTLKDWLMQEA